MRPERGDILVDLYGLEEYSWRRTQYLTHIHVCDIGDTGNYQLTGPDSGEIAMVERRIEEDRLLLDTPFLRPLRAEGALMGWRRSILDILRLRFDPPISVYQQCERYLEKVTDEAQLEKLFAVAVRGENLADFQAATREE